MVQVAEEVQPATSVGRLAFSNEDYARLRADLQRAVNRICPRWLASRSDDLVQVAMMRIMEIQGKSEGNRELTSSYLYRVAYTALVDEIRRWRRRQEVPIEQATVEGRVTSESASPERVYAGREIGRSILDCLAQLGRPRRLAVALYLQGHTVPQASRVLGWSPKRTENLVYRGLADLRTCLASKGVTP
jgi:RNA polymerase sigma-70 factor (ECF subfamily)